MAVPDRSDRIAGAIEIEIEIAIGIERRGTWGRASWATLGGGGYPMRENPPGYGEGERKIDFDPDPDSDLD